MSGLLVFSVIPTIILGPFAGVFADRWDPRNTLGITAALSVPLVLIPTILLVPVANGVTTRLELATVYSAVLLGSIAVQFLRPSSARLLRAVVQDQYLPRVASLTQTSASISILLGPAIAAPIFVAFGPMWGLLLNAISFCLAAAAFSCVRQPSSKEVEYSAPTSRGVLNELKEGVHFFQSSRVLSAVALCMVAAMMGASMVASLEVFFIIENLNSTEAFFGLLSAAEGVGMIVGGAFGVLIAPRVRMVQLLWISVASLGFVILIYSRLTTLWPALIVLVVMGVFSSLLSIALSPLIFQETPERYIGRVNALLNPLIFSGALIGMLSGGVLYSVLKGEIEIEFLLFTLGPLDSIFSLSALICIAAALYAKRSLAHEAGKKEARTRS